MLRAALKFSFIVTTFVSLRAFGQNEAGGKFKFEVPPVPIESARVHGDLIAIAKDLGSTEDWRAEGFRLCPSLSKLIFKISDRIVQTNNLSSFIVAGTLDFKIKVRCWSVLPKATGGTGPQASLSGLDMPAFIAQTSSSEDELAFIIAHEMAHVILRHNELSEGNIRGKVLKFQRQREADADTLATVLLANSDYDPRAAGDALCGLIKFIDGHPLMASCTSIGVLDDGLHGSNGARMNRINKKLAQIGYGPSPRRVQSEEFNQARQEVQGFMARLKAQKRN